MISEEKQSIKWEKNQYVEKDFPNEISQTRNGCEFDYESCIPLINKRHVWVFFRE